MNKENNKRTILCIVAFVVIIVIIGIVFRIKNEETLLYLLILFTLTNVDSSLRSGK